MSARPPAPARPLPSGTGVPPLPPPAVSRTSPPWPSLTSPGCLSPHPVSRGRTTAPCAAAPVLCASARRAVAGALSAGPQAAAGSRTPSVSRGGCLVSWNEKWAQPVWERERTGGPRGGSPRGAGGHCRAIPGPAGALQKEPRRPGAGALGRRPEGARGPAPRSRARRRARRVSGLVCRGKKHCLPQLGLKRTLLTVTNSWTGPGRRLRVGWCGQKGPKEAGMGAERGGGGGAHSVGGRKVEVCEPPTIATAT